MSGWSTVVKSADQDTTKVNSSPKANGSSRKEKGFKNMFFQIVSYLVEFSEGTVDTMGDFYRTIHKYFKKIIFKHSQRISALMMASKLFSIVALLSLAPISGLKVEKQPFNTTIKLDENSPLAVSAPDRQVTITTSEAKIDLDQKTNNLKVSQPTSIYISIERDPSYFRELYQKAGAAYGVPWQLLEAVHYVETGCSDSTSESSYAGATGPMQFMPGTWRTWGVDANGDGMADIHNVEDAVFGAANLLSAGGAAEGNYQSALFNYNHAQWYVDKVLGIARDAGMSV